MMRVILGVLIGGFTIVSTSQGAVIRSDLLDWVNYGYSSRSNIKTERAFAFFESCEPIRGVIDGISPHPGGRHNTSVEIRKPRIRARSVLIIPPLGGATSIDRIYAEDLCSKGIESWIITAWDQGQVDLLPSSDIRSHDVVARKAIAIVRQVVAHMGKAVGIMGTSAGAMIGSVAMALEPKIRTGVFIAGGAGLAEIISQGKATMARQLNNQRIASYSGSREDYRNHLSQNLWIDPLYFAHALRGRPVGVVVALNDEVVPLQNQEMLEQISGAVRLAESRQKHMWAIVSTGLLKSWKVTRFFERNL